MQMKKLLEHVSGYAIYFMVTTPGTWREVLKIGTTAVIKPRADAIIAEARDNQKLSDVELSLVGHKSQDNVEERPPPYSAA